MASHASGVAALRALGLRRRAILVPVLLLLTAFFLLCVGLLSKQPLQYSAAQRAAALARARALAQAGMEDCRCKFSSDIEFPPPLAEGQNEFTYVEEVRDLDGTTRLGGFRVTVDVRWRNPRYRVLRITSEGLAGELDRPSAFFTVQGLLDISLVGREGQPNNPDLCHWIEWRELGP